MKTYLKALHEVLETGITRDDRTGVGTIGVFGMQQRYNLSKGFPAITTKKLAWKSVVGELLWMTEGSGDERRLAEITHGTSEGTVTIWTPNALAPYWKPKAKFEGDLGRVYGVQWRHWRSIKPREPNATFKDSFGSTYRRVGSEVEVKEVDQLQKLIEGIKADPYGRRHILTAWNPGELDAMALPPCHCFAQFYVADGKLSCQMYQRSCDMFLGVPFNIASYSLLTHMVAQVCDLDVGEFVHVLGDAHIYLDHIDQVNEQLKREPLPAPRLWLNPDIKDITKFTMADIRLEGYTSHEAIKAKMAV
ncbi:ThyA Thymidylate synthase [uncultured Caudovirales phage]|uniref:Thymidylate synthase n=1 Tax=uncultured Caudovirales phage TaxID=2100421 RepID=A0A6J5LKS6_9CAUD|nr:ThyA Thymidylate synthase [uncultured Caudovirales phage]